MQEGGLIDRRRSTGGRGRPRDEWSIAATASPTGERPEAYADLARWLVRAMPDGPRRLWRVERPGREIGRELASDRTDDLAESFTQIFTALGFQPTVEIEGPGHLSCGLGNCPYRNSAREAPDVICTLHKGITEGLLDGLDPAARLARFEPHEPDRAGCMVEVLHAEHVAPDAAPR